MREDANGATLVDRDVVVSSALLDDLARALGTTSGADTARLVPFFGPTTIDERTVTDGLGLDLSRGLLGGLGFEWRRPFRPDETVRATVRVDEMYQRGDNTFAVVVAEYHDTAGDLVHRQSATFIERGGS